MNLSVLSIHMISRLCSIATALYTQACVRAFAGPKPTLWHFQDWGNVLNTVHTYITRDHIQISGISDRLVLMETSDIRANSLKITVSQPTYYNKFSQQVQLLILDVYRHD